MGVMCDDVLFPKSQIRQTVNAKRGPSCLWGAVATAGRAAEVPGFNGWTGVFLEARLLVFEWVDINYAQSIGPKY